MKNFFLLIFFFSSFCFADTLPFSSLIAPCPLAVPNDDPGFCPSFQSVAYCHCEGSFSKDYCENKLGMQGLYHKMIATYGSLEGACSPHAQKDTSQQECIDDWNCYWNGGKTSQGKLCSGVEPNGKACDQLF